MTVGRTLYKDPSEGKMAGVCAGIGQYFRVEPIWTRLGFFLFGLLFNWIAVAAYLALALILRPMPEGERSEAGEPKRQDPSRRTPRPDAPRQEMPRSSEAPAITPISADYTPRDLDPETSEEIEIELTAMREQTANRVNKVPASPNYGEMPDTLEGDTSRDSGRTLEGTAPNKRKVLSQ